ncbi:uncharacterized protein N0V89_006833 [Didymosphaeria variabile]|uniref:Uncharacterized protein n=1 Tax=Didymosphaeria variabile TaxID=1932322 RepID=A0A9W9C9L4_9PLEO|nr:uncharacterized protein N0V89_006833 [Didymosphaeria variabile]KAJ4351490.1 hypothetical protein N0V89_006833 [Didymosphaeria variabile]
MPAPSWPVSTLRPADLLSRLPRELRDKIYTDAVDVHGSIGFTEDLLPHVPPILREDTNLLPEALEILVRTKVFNWNWNNPQVAALESTSVCVNPCDIRQLDITCSEHLPSFEDSNFEVLNQHEKTYRRTDSRVRWEQLLDFPRLQKLAIYMQKTGDCSLNTLDFGPIMYALRARKPDINITFYLSFDTILKEYWEDPMWGNPADAGPGSYKPMGYVEMSDLVAPATQKDLDYVQEYLPRHLNIWRMPGHRSIKQGLLDETPADRRALAEHYAVQEPALLRYQMREHFELYQKPRESTAEETST